MARFFAYNSVKLIRIEHPVLVLIYYTLILAVLTYVVAYTIIIQKGYQEYDTLVGSTMIKTKGVAFYDTSQQTSFVEVMSPKPLQALPPIQLSQGTASSSKNSNLLEIRQEPTTAPPAPPAFDASQIKFYDANDLVIPPFIPGGFFVATSIVETPAQTRGSCAGNDKKTERCNCTGGDCCVAGTTTNNGVKVGTCTGDFCTIQGWCPLEDESKPVTLNQVANWTVMIRINANFPRFHQQLNNTGKSELEMGVNLFTINDLITRSGNNFSDVKAKGALLLVQFKYDCDLNKPIEQCQPAITSSRLDQNSSLTTGFNYRFISKYHVQQTEYRDLSKVYGFRVVVSVEGRGGRFNASVLSTTIGAGLALLGVAAVICDVVMQYILPDRAKFVSRKFEEVSDEVDGGVDGGLLTSDPNRSA